MIERSVLIQEIDSLPSRYYSDVFDFVSYIKEKKVKKSIDLKQAAEMAVNEYRTNKELTAFCAIDGEPFYETR